MQRTEIATAARHYLNEIGAGFVTGTVLTRAIDRSLRRINSDSAYNRADVTVSIKSGVREYALPTGVKEVYETRLGTGSQRKGLKPTSRAALCRTSREWEAATSGTPTHYYSDGKWIGFDRRPRPRSAWTNGYAYAAGDIVTPSATDNGLFYKCTAAGTSAASEPSWPTTIDGTVTETAGPTWQQAGSTRVYVRCCKNPPPLSYATSAPSWLPEDKHDTVGVRAAIDIAEGLKAADDYNQTRLEGLYRQYNADIRELRMLANGRSQEHTPRFSAGGYATFRRGY